MGGAVLIVGKRDVLHVSLLETVLPKDNMALAWLTQRQLHVPDLQKECEVVKLGCSGGDWNGKLHLLIDATLRCSLPSL